MKNFFLNISINNGKLLAIVVLLCLSLGFSSCFTGIENTKKINLSREDKKNSIPTPEEKFMTNIIPMPLKNWDIGKTFYVSDNKALLVIIPTEGILPVAPDSVKGKILNFQGVESKINAAGKLTVSLVFSDNIYLYNYDTGKEFTDAMENVKSDQIPMLIDLDMVDQAAHLLKGKEFWTRSPLWYDSNGERIEGRRFTPVTIVDVKPGDMVFPLKLEIKDDHNQVAYMMMNFGNEDNESRTFSNLFSFSNIRKHYPGIDDDTWRLITQGKVKLGMTKEECRLSLGNPSDLNSGHDYSQTLDIWSYENGRVLWFEDGRLVRIRQ